MYEFNGGFKGSKVFIELDELTYSPFLLKPPIPPILFEDSAYVKDTFLILEAFPWIKSAYLNLPRLTSLDKVGKGIRFSYFYLLSAKKPSLEVVPEFKF